MKEKAFKQEYSLFAQQSTFTRAANKMYTARRAHWLFGGEEE